MNADIQAVIFDVDGTLYDYRTHSVLPSTIEALHRLKERGIVIIIASGRSYALLGKEITQNIAPDFYVLANGHEVLGKNGTPIQLISLAREQIVQIEEIAVQRNFHMMLKYHQFNCVYSGWDEMLAVFGQIGLDAAMFRYCPARDYHFQELPLGVTLKGSCDLREQLADLKDELRVEYFHDPSECDIFCRYINKWSGLCEVLKQENICAKHCIAFGDSGNDVDILRAVGYGVAMGNACEDAKYAAKYICGCSWENGIYQFLHRNAII